MERADFYFQIQRLALAFEKTLKDDFMDLWWEELKDFSLREIQGAVRFFLESDAKTFPKIGEFKIAIRGKDRKSAEGKQPELPSCPRCSHGFCSVERWIGRSKHSFSFRCSCPSGNSFPGLPLVDPNEQTVKEARSRRTHPAPPPL